MRSISPLDQVVTKARRYVRTATALLVVALVLSAVMVLMLARQGDIQRENFDANSNVRAITVDHRVDESGGFPLEPQDAETVRALAGADAVVTPRLTLGGGLTHDGSAPMFIVGIDPAASTLIGVADMVDDTGYSVAGPAGDTVVQVPVVTADTGAGVTSDRLAPYSLHLSPTVDPVKATYLDGSRADHVTYVTTATFWALAELMLDKDQREIQAAAASGELPMIPLVSVVYVEVPDIQRVRTTAAAIEDAGFGVSYALQAFDEVERSLATQRWLSTALGAVVLVGVGAYVIVSWRSYLRLSRRDIGILKHWRVEPRDIRRLYAKSLRRSLLVPLAATTGTLIVGSVWLFGIGPGLTRAGIVSAAYTLGLTALYVVIVRSIIGPWTQRDVLTLLKQDREFQ